MERFSTRFAIGAADDQDGTFRGIASVFGSVAQGIFPTKFVPGAFKKTLQEQGDRVKILWQHEVDKPIGKPITLAESSLGLDLYAKISKTAHGQDALTLIRDGVIDELSIGFDPIAFSFEETQGEAGIYAPPTRIVTEARLWEISCVTFAADAMAKITNVHALGGGTELIKKIVEAHKLDASDGASLSAILSVLTVGPEEGHEGRTLSGKSKQLVSAALQALQALLDAAEPPKNDKEGNRHSPVALTGDGAPKKSIKQQLREAEIAFAETLL